MNILRVGVVLQWVGFLRFADIYMYMYVTCDT